MVDWAKDRTGNPAVDRSQDRAKENFERGLPAWVRDGKELPVAFDADTVLTVHHRLGRRPKGWLTHSHKGDSHIIIETDRNDLELKLKNNFAGATDVTCTLWVW